MYRKSKPVNIKKNLQSFYLFHVPFSQNITNSSRNKKKMADTCFSFPQEYIFI